jgi:hypothetical protein
MILVKAIPKNGSTFPTKMLLRPLTMRLWMVRSLRDVDAVLSDSAN